MSPDNGGTSQLIDQHVMQTYGRFPVTFARGRGARLWDNKGKEYLDFLAGIAVCGLGHAHPEVTQAVADQAALLTHVSNLFYTEPQARVAQLLTENSFATRVFFCNSGAEANEGVLKIARRWGNRRMNGAFKVITMLGSFHGRTLATLSATGQEKIQKDFQPLMPGFVYAPFGDLAAVQALWDDQTCGVLVEPVLGEGGVVPAPDGYLAGLRELCDAEGGLLMYDEIQTGLGRTGRLFAYEHSGVAPDVMSLAKSLANGLPAGAVLAGEKTAGLLDLGSHATTFGAGPVIMAAARVVLETLTAPGFMEQVRETGKYFRSCLDDLAGRHPDQVKGVRGLGLILGLELNQPCAALVGRLLEKGLVTNCTQERVLRFLPPLIIGRPEIDQLVATLDRLLPELEKN